MERLKYRVWDGAKMHYKFFTTQEAWNSEKNIMHYWGTTVDGKDVYEDDYLFAEFSKKLYLVIKVDMHEYSYFNLKNISSDEIVDMIGHNNPILRDENLILAGNKHETVLRKKDIEKLRAYKKSIYTSIGLRLSKDLTDHERQLQKQRFNIQSSSDADLDNLLLDDFNIKTILPSSAIQLERSGLLNQGICPLCGTAPIGKDSTWNYSWSWNTGAKLYVCQSCHSSGINKQKKKEGCYIATVAFGDENHPSVVTLKRFRDMILFNSNIGTQFIRIYYDISPSIASHLKGKVVLNKLIKIVVISPLVIAIRKFYKI